MQIAVGGSWLIGPCWQSCAAGR